MRIEHFGDNYLGGIGSVPCPLCKMHHDNQEMAFQCPEDRKSIKKECSLEDVVKRILEWEQ